jgi:hypothetical protein
VLILRQSPRPGSQGSFSKSRQFLQPFRIASPQHRDLQGCGFDLAEVVQGEFDAICTYVLGQSLQLCRARNGHDPWLLRQQPGYRNLCRRRLFTRCDHTKQIDQRLIRPQGLLSEARKGAPEVDAVEGDGLIDLSREEPLSQWAVRNEADPEFLKCRYHVLLGCPHRSIRSSCGWTRPVVSSAKRKGA